MFGFVLFCFEGKIPPEAHLYVLYRQTEEETKSYPVAEQKSTPGTAPRVKKNMWYHIVRVVSAALEVQDRKESKR